MNWIDKLLPNITTLHNHKHDVQKSYEYKNPQMNLNTVV